MGASGAKYGIATSHFYLDRRDPGDGVRRALHALTVALNLVFF